MGWSKDPGPTYDGGQTDPPFSFYGAFMGQLSIFVDESGDFGEYSTHSPYYIITMIFHDQNKDIQPNINHLNESLENIGLGKDFAIHTEPIIRREEIYENMSPNERRAILSKLFYFVMKSDISYKTFIFEKRQFDDLLKLEGRMAKEMSLFIRENIEYFQTFDEVILYYDNGQRNLNRILNSVLFTELSKYDVRKVSPKDYKLFQVADLICTLQLLGIKHKKNELSKSELLIFHNPKDLKKQFLKPIQKKEFNRLK
ncbi:MAG: DUF3800 domain-containing protein [Treponema sp.]|nr:DUF3800 domain-containing protein [Treponema sp.]